VLLRECLKAEVPERVPQEDLGVSVSENDEAVLIPRDKSSPSQERYEVRRLEALHLRNL
jgi:hypothetical protein